MDSGVPTRGRGIPDPPLTIQKDGPRDFPTEGNNIGTWSKVDLVYFDD